jgi:hypothetical protein
VPCGRTHRLSGSGSSLGEPKARFASPARPKCRRTSGGLADPE